MVLQEYLIIFPVSPSSAQIWHPMPALCGLHNFIVWIKNQWDLCGVGVSELYFRTGGTLGLTQLYFETWDNDYTRESPFFFLRKKSYLLHIRIKPRYNTLCAIYWRFSIKFKHFVAFINKVQTYHHALLTSWSFHKSLVRWGLSKVKIQVSRREFHEHIHLD